MLRYQKYLETFRVSSRLRVDIFTIHSQTLSQWPGRNLYLNRAKNLLPSAVNKERTEYVAQSIESPKHVNR